MYFCTCLYLIFMFHKELKKLLRYSWSTNERWVKKIRINRSKYHISV